MSRAGVVGGVGAVETQPRVRVGVIGMGGIARTHLKALAALPDVELAGLCDLDAGRLAAAQATWGGPTTRAFADYAQMLEEVRPDGVWVLVSVPATSRVAGDCLRRGFDTLLEKPPGLTTEETRELAELAERHGRRAMVAFNRRFNPWVLEARRRLAAAGSARPAVILSEYHKGPDQYGNYPPEVNRRWIGVDAIHALDLLRHIGGEVRAVRARSDRHLHGDLPDSFHGVVEFASGTVGQFVSTYTSVPKIERLQLFGERCWAVTEGIDSGMNTGRVYHDGGRDGGYQDLSLPAADRAGSDTFGYWAEDRYFVERLRDGRALDAPACDLRDAVVTMELVDTFLRGWSDV